MKYINFNNLKNLDSALFYEDKSKCLLQGKHFLTKEQQQSKGVSWEDFDSGYAICEPGEIVLDTDNAESSNFVDELIAPFRDHIRIEKTKKGYHYYIKLSQEIKGKKDFINALGHKIELKGTGEWVFSSNNGKIKDYYNIIENRPIKQLSEENTTYLLSKLNTLLGSGNSMFLARDSKYIPEINDKLGGCLENVLANEYFDPASIRSFCEEFRYLFDDDYNPYKDRMPKIKKGGRQTFLFRVWCKLALAANIESQDNCLRFIKLVNKTFLEEPLDEFEIDMTLGPKRNNTIKFFRIEDLAEIRVEYQTLDLYQDLTGDANKDSYYIIEKKDKNEGDSSGLYAYRLNCGGLFIWVRKLAPGDRALMKELLVYPTLAKKYIGLNKNGKTCLKQEEIRGVYFENRNQLGIDPFKPVLSSFNNCLKIDFSTRQYSDWVKASNVNKCPSASVFLGIPYVKVAIENLVGSKERLALMLKDIRQAVFNKRPTKQATILSGEGGIGKDAFMDFIAGCFLTEGPYYYKSDQDKVKKGGRFNARFANASIIALNEAGTSGSPVDKELLSTLNQYIDNPYITIEEKFKNEETIKLHLLLLVISTNSTIDIDRSYNQTRFIMFNCPGLRPIRNNPENEEYFFKGKSQDVLIKEYAEDFVNFILYAPEIDEWAKEAKDDRKYFDDFNNEAYNSNDLGECMRLIDDLNEGNFDDLIEWTEKQELFYEPEDQYRSFKIRLYCVLYKSLGGKDKELEKFRLLDSKGLECKMFNRKNDFLASTFNRLAHWLLQEYKSSGEYKTIQDCKELINNKITRALFEQDNFHRVRFKPKFTQGYKIQNQQIVRSENV